MKQKAIKVDDREALRELNGYLEDGWKVASMCAMPSSASVALAGGNYNSREIKTEPTCLVIIEK